MHILSLGASKKLSSYFYTTECIKDENGNEHIDSRIKEIMNQTSEIKSDLLSFACTQFLFEKIRENGGVSVICHPMWKPFNSNGKRVDVPISLVNDLIEHKKFDGFEVVSGSRLNETHVSNLQHSIILGKANPSDFIYIGVTDSHIYSSDEIVGKHFTIVFAKENSEKSIIDALRNKMSVAVEIDESGKAQCYGNFRLSLFSYFLLKEYFPMRDKAALNNGCQMEETLFCND